MNGQRAMGRLGDGARGRQGNKKLVNMQILKKLKNEVLKTKK